MDKQEFAEGMKEIASSFMDDRFLGEGVVQTWYRHFKDYDRETFMDAVDAHAARKAKPPTISELVSQCEDARRRNRILATAMREPEYFVTDEDFDIDDEMSMAAHPYEEGWRVNQDGKWVRLMNGEVQTI